MQCEMLILKVFSMLLKPGVVIIRAAITSSIHSAMLPNSCCHLF